MLFMPERYFEPNLRSSTRTQGNCPDWVSVPPRRARGEDGDASRLSVRSKEWFKRSKRRARNRQRDSFQFAGVETRSADATDDLQRRPNDSAGGDGA
jgi:hypothetical protein